MYATSRCSSSTPSPPDSRGLLSPQIPSSLVPYPGKHQPHMISLTPFLFTLICLGQQSWYHQHHMPTIHQSMAPSNRNKAYSTLSFSTRYLSLWSSRMSPVTFLVAPSARFCREGMNLTLINPSFWSCSTYLYRVSMCLV